LCGWKSCGEKEGSALVQLFQSLINACGNPGQALPAVSTIALVCDIEDGARCLAFADAHFDTEHRSDAMSYLLYLSPSDRARSASIAERLLLLLCEPDPALLDRCSSPH
jgi:hypothetical protein